MRRTLIQADSWLAGRGGPGGAARPQMRAMMERQQADLRAVLTPEQQRQFDLKVAEMRSRMERGGGRAGGPPPP